MQDFIVGFLDDNNMFRPLHNNPYLGFKRIKIVQTGHKQNEVMKFKEHTDLFPANIIYKEPEPKRPL